MTVFVMYAPRVLPVKREGTDNPLVNNREQRYGIPWEFADVESIEVYEIRQSADPAERRREQLRRQDYRVIERKDQTNIISEGGAVVVERLHPDWVTHVSIERNTLIDQTADFSTFRGFPGRMVEFTLDKHTLIAQELVQRKCTAITSIPITQEVTITAYDDLKASVVNFMVDKIVTILREISQTAVDCKDDLENA